MSLPIPKLPLESERINRQGGGIEPLHVSMPLELKSSPSTSPTHLGLCAISWKLNAAKALRNGMRARASAPSGVLRGHSICAIRVSWGSKDRRGYGATAARLTPDQKVGSSNLSALTFASALCKQLKSFQRARGVVVSHLLSMREALGSIPSVSIAEEMCGR